MKKWFNPKRFMTVLMSVAMLLTGLPTPLTGVVNAATAPHPVINVKLTVSMKGKFAKDNQGKDMAERDIVARDLDGDGVITVYEVLVPAHELYNSPDGLDPGSGFVTKLWGDTSGNFLFFINNMGITTSATSPKDPVEDGDLVTAAILVPEAFYSDQIVYFTADKKTINKDEKLTLTLKGHVGMAYTELMKEDKPIAGATVKTADGTSLGFTDGNGQITVSFPDEGKIILTAEGADYLLTPFDEDDDGDTYYTIMDESYNILLAYTDNEPATKYGPYQLADIKFSDPIDYLDDSAIEAALAAHPFYLRSKDGEELQLVLPPVMIATAFSLRVNDPSKPYPEVTGVKLNETSLKMEVGATKSLEATVSPNNATEKGVSFYSNNPDIVSVDKNGKVTAKAQGKATITAITAEGGKTAFCEVDAVKSVSGVSLDKTSLPLTTGDTAKLTATVAPADATNKNVTWKSSNEKVATVDAEGNVKAIAAGKAVITVTTVDQGKTAECEVTVSDPYVAVTDVTLNKSVLSLVKGTSANLEATISPDNATDKSLTWTSSKPVVATVDANGKVTAVKTGTTYVTVAAKDGKSAKCKVIVTKKVVDVKGVSLDKKNTTLEKGSTLKLKAIVNPENATNNDVTWKSSKKSIASVDQNGVVTAHKAGKTTITVTTADKKKTAKCEVTVKVTLKEITLNKTEYSLKKGKKFTLKATAVPKGASLKGIKWKSSKPSVVSVNNKGQITAKKKGTANITAYIGKIKAKCKVTVTE